jgi:hypothetical protein
MIPASKRGTATGDDLGVALISFFARSRPRLTARSTSRTVKLVAHVQLRGEAHLDIEDVLGPAVEAELVGGTLERLLRPAGRRR